MNYKSYQHILKLRMSNEEPNPDLVNLLDGDVSLYYKIDGTNSCIWLKDDGTLGFGSRKREVFDTKDGDNGGFVHKFNDEDHKEMREDIERYLHDHPNYIVYGEWLIPHTLKTYKDSAWNQLYVFDVYDSDTDSYIDYDIYSEDFTKKYPHIIFIPRMEKLHNPTPDDIKERLSRTGEFLVADNAGLGEGIVIKNYNYKNPYGHIIWGKLLTEDFANKKQRVRQNNAEMKEENKVEYDIAKLLTADQISKEKLKIEEAHNTPWKSNYIPELIGRTYNAFWEDNWDLIIMSKFKNSTINLRMLKTVLDNIVRDFLKERGLI